ncbi:hypothetical protein SPRG_01528 [Saprolegnia parasitica CBS 223.65]|uniref:Multidrug resistance-associated protein 1 n=1 Tax=Saprolegnia parasitica (strain CBS 223.65) TaxID=695850 RepID=A0A067D5V4_SAPPC|nr:hypothetical protein SPRG_01528 [Saprolegnia parasitica CBS 223.65]KDO34392.1 hypothetical protein SPRG_01528 [Saprolegnia parasitica CBS 223.65]|eukprot:XP_012195128.1 hypothetical protein SPRG_01528 [Saprolegnia parasitica CBS 223.65]
MSRAGAKYQSVAAAAPAPAATHPVDTAGWFSRTFYAWATPLLTLGNERQLDPSDLWPLQSENKCGLVSAVFEPKFRATRSVIKTILATYGWRFFFIGLLQVGSVLCTLYGPIVLRHVLEAIEAEDAGFDVRIVLQYVVSLFAVKVLQAIVAAHATFDNQVITVKITSALQHLLFQKALVLDAACRRDKTAGEITNMFSTDIMWIINFSIFLNQLWLIPIQILIVLYMLYDVIGWRRLLRAAFKEVMVRKDARMNVINEVFGAMQILKLNAWEEKFSDKISTCREAELTTLWKVWRLQSSVTFLLYTAPALVTTASFAVYTLVMKESLSSSKMFTALSLFTLLKYPMISLPQIIATMMQAFVSLKRIMEFLNMDEKDNDVVKTPETISTSELNAYAEKKIDIEIADATFAWDVSGKPLFDGINLQIKRGEFVLVHGAVGEGKSSLMSALLGEMHKRHGSVFVGGHVAYFSQQAWIQNLTIRDNILFGKPYDRKKYNAVLDACALSKDLTLFPAGDRTEIGQKGVNLSGGQKARISLARACYSDADIFLLDSPLSAVDAIVSNEIFTKCFLGLLRHKTIVLVTHSPEIIASSYIDRSIELKQGKLLVTEVEKLDAPLLVSPLKARVGFVKDDVVDDDDAPTSRLFDLLLTPSASSPYSAEFDGLSYTPVDATEKVYAENGAPDGRLVQDEERSHGRVSSAVFFNYMKQIGGLPMVLYLITVLSLWQGLSIGSDLWLSKWSASTATESRETFALQAPWYLSIYAGLAFGGVILTVFRTLSIYVAGLRASRSLFANMTSALLHAPMRFFDANPLGRILNRYSGDMSTVDQQIPSSLSAMSANIFIVGFSLGTTICVVKSLGLILLPLLLLYLKVGQFYIQPAREMERVNKTARSPMLNLISEAIEGALVIRAFGPKQVRRFQRLHHHNVDGSNQATWASQVVTQWFSLRIQLISAVMILVISGALIAMRSYLNAGLIGLVMNYALTVLPQLESIVRIWSSLETAMVGPERVAEYAAIAPEAPRVIHGATAHDWPTTGHITFSNMSFRYKEHDALVLKDVNVDIASGEKIGIVGRTGAGKSSLTMALFRINELASGSISIDGVDIKSVGVKTLRSAIAIIPQNPVLFKGTLRNYLDPFSDYGDDQLWDALKKVMLQSRIASVDGQLESHVEENGENFSVGERQMLCMARALLRQARIVVMDEATAAIDHETDQNLQRVIRTAFAASTVLTIAHRLDTVLDCDRILVFDQGRLVQCDTPQQLIDDGTGIFYELCTEGGYLDKVLSSP